MPPPTGSSARSGDQASAAFFRPESPTGGAVTVPGPVVIAVLTLVIKLVLAMPDRLLSLTRPEAIRRPD